MQRECGRGLRGLSAPKKKPKPHSRDLRKNRVSDVAETFFITKSLQPKKAALGVQARDVVVSAFEFAVQQERIYLGAFVVMPDHWHALVALRGPWTLPRFMHAAMSFIAARTCKELQSAATDWQDSYYDTLIHTARQFAYVEYYIEQNPVTKGLVKNPEEWPASSASRMDLVSDPWPLPFD